MIRVENLMGIEFGQCLMTCDGATGLTSYVAGLWGPTSTIADMNN